MTLKYIISKISKRIEELRSFCKRAAENWGLLPWCPIATTRLRDDAASVQTLCKADTRCWAPLHKYIIPFNPLSITPKTMFLGTTDAPMQTLWTKPQRLVALASRVWPTTPGDSHVNLKVLSNSKVPMTSYDLHLLTHPKLLRISGWLRVGFCQGNFSADNCPLVQYAKVLFDIVGLQTIAKNT